MKPFSNRKRPLKIRHLAQRDVCSIHQQVGSTRLQSRPLKHVTETHARPPCISNRAKMPLRTRYRWAVEAAAVSSAFENAYQFTPEKSPQVGKSQSEGPFHQTVDYKLPLLQLHFGDVSMAADEEVLDRGDLVHEAVNRHFEIKRAGRESNHSSPLFIRRARCAGPECGSAREEEAPAGKGHMATCDSPTTYTGYRLPVKSIVNRRIVRRILLIAALIVFTMLIGTLGFRLLEGYPLFDAFYMTLITITTVGYQEIRPLSHAGRVFNSFLILFGVTAMFVAVGAMTQTIIELQLQDRYGERRRKRAIMRMKDHYIVCGFGRVGRNAAFELQRAGVPFLVIDRNEQRVERATQAGMAAIRADATQDESLREAGVERARGFIAALATDADNVFVILSVKTLNPRVTVVTRASEEDAEEKLRRAGADTVLSPYSITGHRLAQALVRPHVVQLLDFAGQAVGLDVTMEQLRVAPDSARTSRKLGDIVSHEARLIVLAVGKPDGKMIFNPPVDMEVSGGDVLIVMGEQQSLRHLEKVLTNSR